MIVYLYGCGVSWRPCAPADSAYAKYTVWHPARCCICISRGLRLNPGSSENQVEILSHESIRFTLLRPYWQNLFCFSFFTLLLWFSFRYKALTAQFERLTRASILSAFHFITRKKKSHIYHIDIWETRHTYIVFILFSLFIICEMSNLTVHCQVHCLYCFKQTLKKAAHPFTFSTHHMENILAPTRTTEPESFVCLQKVCSVT